jgi:hypothetical protein
MKIVCFVLSTVKYPDRINRIKETWANDIDNIFFNTTPPEHAVSDIVKSITYHRIVTDEDMKNLYDLTK